MTPVASMLCHRSKVCVSGINPLIANSDGGIAVFVAINMAADDDNPIAHTEHVPK